ncbi:universal stress protein [Denitromonas iodatirespirans]|uniref:Universal stress protein n=1 Tax=Denitromonas iodatirespirans TaxID=2795389 RepID=A0A944DEK8_DENI1|nr:universal stress protein [Denitromonas iodatirespirans]MBT0964122.1 universal stress protein [Denitromonas iodatirespirans]
MTRLHAVLAATDLSAPARHAAQRAALLASETGARLELLHVLEKTTLDELQAVFVDQDAAVLQRIRELARDALSQLATDIGEPLGVTAGLHLEEGAVLETIAAEADRLDASLLVLGARGTDFMRQWLLGATAERLLRKVRRPILAVKQPPHEHYRKVLVPVDFSPWSAGAVRLARAVAPKAELTLMHAFELPYEGKLRLAFVEEDVILGQRIKARHDAVARLQQFAADAGLSGSAWRTSVIHGATALRVLEQEEELGADLIVLGKHGADMTEELLLGSVTKHVLAHARCDVLAAYR